MSRTRPIRHLAFAVSLLVVAPPAPAGEPAEPPEGVQIEDGRLAPKTPIYSFHLGGKAYAVAHASIEGGRVFPLEEHPGRCVVLSRPRGSSLFRSTQAYVLPTEQAPRQGEVEEFVAQKTRAALDGADPLPGFDTYWCNWIAVNKDSRLLQ